MNLRITVLAAGLLGVAACSPGDENPQRASGPAVAPTPGSPAGVQTAGAEFLDRGLDFGRLVTGGKLYGEHCAVCHGSRAEGHPNWQRRDAQGRFPPPPLNGTAHTWHHSPDVLKDVIRNGTLARGGGMPAWREKLSDDEIDAIIDWIISRWPEDVYRAWREANPPK